MTTIKFEAIDNFRDFGGYGTACGRGLKAGRLFRSANHAYATDGDLAALRDLGVGVIVDLRRRREREREPSRRWEGFAGAVIENDIDGPEHDWADALKAASSVNADWFFQDSLDFYRAAPHAERMVDLFSRYFRTLAETEGAVVVHCAAGKDRTGVLAASLLLCLGATDADIVADYGRSGPNIDAIHERTRPVMSVLMAQIGIDLDAAARAAADDKPFDEYAMAQMLDVLRKRHGDPLVPLRAAGLSDALIAALREKTQVV